MPGKGWQTMRARDLIAETGSAIGANRARSALTVLGIVIGIAAVISMTALIDGIKMALVGELGLNQARLVLINCWPASGEVTSDDLDALAEETGLYDFVTYTMWGSGKINTGTTEKDMSILGCAPEYFTAMGSKLLAGRLYTKSEVDRLGQVIVLDTNSVKELFGSADAECVGQIVRIGNDEYTIAGVVESNTQYETFAYMPATTLEARVMGWSSIDSIYGFAREDADMSSIADETKAWLCARFGIVDAEDGEDAEVYTGWVDVTTMASMLEQLDTTMASFQLLMTAVASISLLVGGIGIMNMMLTNVTERIREIGLRKALGARRSDITGQFLMESVTICVVGGLLGIAFGYAGAWALADLARGMAGVEQLEPVITPTAVALAAGICVGIGVLFGYYPARRAAKLDPVESLRYQ